MQTGHYQRVINQATFGYVFGTVATDDPADTLVYELLEVNPAFEIMTGLKDSPLLKRRFTIGELEQGSPDDFGLRRCGETAAGGEERSFDHYMTSVRQWFRVTVWSPEKNQFVATYHPAGGPGMLPEPHPEDIIDRREVEESLRESEERYRTLFAHSPLGIVHFGKDSTILNVNNEFVKVIGSSRESLIGFNIFKNVTDENMLAAIREALNGGTGYYEQVYHSVTAKKSTSVRGKFVSFPGDDGRIIGGVGIFEDISDRKLAENSLELARQSYLDVFNSVSEAIYVHDEAGLFIDVNKGAELMYGYSRDELIGQSPATVAAPGYNDIDGIIRKTKVVSETGIPVQFDFWARRKNGEIFTKDVIVNKGRYFGKDVLITTARDITEKKQAESALQKSLARNKALLDANPDMMFVFSDNGIIVDIHSLGQSGYNLNPESYLGKPVEEVFPAEGAALTRQNTAAVLATGQPVYTTYSVDLHGTKKHFESRYVPCGTREVLSIVRDITERKKAEEALIESENQMAAILRAIPDLLFVFNINGDYLNVYTEDDSKLLLPKEQLIGKNVRELFPPEVAEKSLEAFQQSIASNELVEFSYSLNVSGQPDFFEARIVPASDEKVFVMVRDISERKRHEQEITLLGKSIEQSPVSIIITEAGGNIEYVNPKFTEVTGYQPEEVIGANPRILKSGEQPPETYSELWKTIKSGQSWYGELLNRKKSGELFWENVSISPILNQDGRLTHFVAVKEDISEKKRMIQELINARDKAEESDRLKSAFLANMSHEIRTPMNGILGFAALLKEPGLSGEEQQHHIGIIEKSGIRMLNIINDIVDISKIESGQMEVSISETNINEQTEYIYTFFRPEVEAKGIRLFLKNGLPANQSVIRTDREKIYAILTNLVKNAIKYTNEGFIEFGYFLKADAVGSPAGAVMLEFFIRDTGIGIASDRQLPIFERFIQADISDKQAHQGAGLGLSITKAYVEMLGGRIWVQSESGKGSSFCFTIPYNPDPERKGEASTEEKPGAEMNPVQKLKILIAEDDETSGLLISRILKKIGREFLIARTGMEAVGICRNHADLDLILMDIKMPEMDGYEATRQIRQFNREVVIISQTAYGLAGDRERALRAGCNEYLPKPIQKDELQEMIRRFFDKTVPL